jgi:hypothetical protein
MIMSTLASHDGTLDFLPSAKRKSGRPNPLTTLRLVAEAVGEGFDAARHYQALRTRGVPHAVAARQVFAKHYASR